MKVVAAKFCGEVCSHALTPVFYYIANYQSINDKSKQI